jgi:hypothetical protein
VSVPESMAPSVAVLAVALRRPSKPFALLGKNSFELKGFFLLENTAIKRFEGDTGGKGGNG